MDGHSPRGVTANQQISPLRLRKWQSEALGLWLAQRSGSVEVVTGAGKTLFALSCIHAHLSGRQGATALILVPNITLLDQWADAAKEHLGLNRNDLRLMGGGVKDRSTRPVTIAVVNSIRDNQIDLYRQQTLLVADECHRYGSSSNRAAIKGKWEATLGLSATPRREFDDWYEAHVEPIIGPIFYSYGYREALHDGTLTPFILENFDIHNTIGRFVDPEYGRLTIAADIISSRPAMRSIVFHESIEAADKLCTLISQRGLRARAYHSHMSPISRMQTLLMYRTGQLDTLVTCRALDEGFDAPKADFGLICKSTRSRRQRIQRIGRLVRRSPGKESATITTLFDGDKERLSLLEEAADLEQVAGVTWYTTK